MAAMASLFMELISTVPHNDEREREEGRHDSTAGKLSS